MAKNGLFSTGDFMEEVRKVRQQLARADLYRRSTRHAVESAIALSKDPKAKWDQYIPVRKWPGF